MSSLPTYLASDVHLGAVPPERERAFVRWLEHAAREAGEIIINGDLFDFWFEYRSAIPRGHTRVLAALAHIVDSGTPIRFVGGNHDWWGGSYLEDEIGLILHPDPIVFDLAGHRTFLAHGDGLGRGDLGYKVLRAILRGRLTRWGFKWLHPDLGAAVARRVSSTDTHGDQPGQGDKARSDALEQWALEKLRTEPELELVVLGHTHMPKLIEVGDRRWYVNGGDWVYHQSFAVFEQGQAPRLEEWTG